MTLGPETSGPGPTRALARIHAGALARLGLPRMRVFAVSGESTKRDLQKALFNFEKTHWGAALKEDQEGYNYGEDSEKEEGL
ncbi:hypothetical protein NDU88_009657 [Pleurodeles waltl]|uniref:Uncharacterized protein n=1 Tax=Pleurodeles waltl TaxID=8319 RepID=A0AAV7RZ19_PLEWA|nr:hypothetical protein NDU88_009657 [Pleurodeles waltl]